MGLRGAGVPRAAVRMEACQDSRAVSAALQMMVSPTVASADPALEVISKMRHISQAMYFTAGHCLLFLMT